jgi:hypothetical protein
MDDHKNSPVSHLDERGHSSGCAYFRRESPLADSRETHVDLFCPCHRFIEPQVLSNGTDIAWPAGWGERQAEEWRVRKGLAYLPTKSPG